MPTLLMRAGIFPKRKSRLSPQRKAIAAARALISVVEGTMDDKQVGVFLREAVGLNWSLFTAIQYLTGQEAIGAVEGLPAEWAEDEMNKQQIVAVMAMAHDIAANFHPGVPLSAGWFVKHFKRG